MPVRWANERERDVSRKREKARDQKLVHVPNCKNRPRRKRLEADDIAWLMHYFGPKSEVRDPFTYQFTEQQRLMIAAFGKAIRKGGDQSIAASRGEGKTTILERLITKYTLQGALKYAVLFQATGTLADNSLDSIKIAIEENLLLLADYPEVCAPVRALENTPNRAHYQLVQGKRHDNGKYYKMAPSRFTWCGQEIIFPKVPGSPSSGSIIATRGLDSAVRGLKKRGLRPQLAAIDDPDTEETAISEAQAKKLEDRIDKAIGGLGTQRKPIARILLTTIQSRVSASFKFTEPAEKPSWKGKRFRFLVQPPERTDLWDEFIQLKKLDWENNSTEAHEFYRVNRAQMDAGSIVANPNRHTDEEISALEQYYTLVARLGLNAVLTEYDNDPPEEDGPVESGITATRIQKRLSGYPRRIVPPECLWLTRGIDVQKAGLHYVVKAWRGDATNYVIDYGFHETHGTTYGSDDGIELALRRAILELFELSKSEPYRTVDGRIVDINMSFIDSGWQAPAIYSAVAEIGLGVRAAKGHGKSHGCATPNFHDLYKRTMDRKPGEGYFEQRQKSKIWLVHCDTDRWKSFDHARWLTQEGKPGAAYLFGEIGDEERRWLDRRMPRDSQGHFAFAKHLTSEVETEDVVRGVYRRIWRVKPGRVQNHYFDASYLADVAASMLGVRLLGETKAASTLPPGERPSARDLARRK